MDFEEAFAKCIFDGNTQGIKALGVDNECINDIVFFYFFEILTHSLFAIHQFLKKAIY